METFKRTPLQLFNLPQHFVIPLFQRPYVWDEDEQWEPLWNDVRRVAELRIAEPHLNPQHFLGAVVLQAQGPGVNHLPTWTVIDGQQRLTTLQVMTDAASAVFSLAGIDRLANQLEWITHNSADYVPDGESRQKIRHLNNDRAPFDEVMTVEPPIDYSSLDHGDARIVRAHQYFTTAITQWLGNPEDSAFTARAEQLAHVLREDLQLVTIELLATENSQEIFETLNARGTPLTAADLIRNFVFQRLEAEGADVQKAYKEHWPFETRFWNKEVSVGRHLVSRSSLFLNQWLIARTGEEIGPQATFSRFKAYVEHDPTLLVGELLPVIEAQARMYEQWTEAAAKASGSLGRVEMAVYRMQASGVEVLKPLLIWLHQRERNVPAPVIDEVVAAAESWVVRRQLLRLSNSDLGRIVADLITAHSDAPSVELADRIRTHLSRLDVASTYWPGDREVRAALVGEPTYRRYPRARLRSYLEAIENQIRAETGQPQVERAGFPIEHVLPQKWREHWKVDDPADAERRQAHVHRLGNLTLLTTALNSKVSNGPWSKKRGALLDHNTIKLTGRLVAATEGVDWDEGLIDSRTTELIEVMLDVWPVPDGHVGEVSDPQSKTQDWVQFKHLVDDGLVPAGTRLVATHKDHKGTEAVVTDDGRIQIDGQVFATPSGAGRHLRKRATNGWYFWAVPDGRRLREVRVAYRGLGGAEMSHADVSSE